MSSGHLDPLSSPPLTALPIEPIDRGSGPPLRGPNVKWGDIYPLSWRIGGAVALLFGVTLVVLASLMAHGTIPVSDTVFTGFKYAACIVGGAQVIAIPGAIYYGRTEKKTRETAMRILANTKPQRPLIPEEPRQPRRAPGAPVSQPPVQAAPPPVPAAEWDARLKDPLRRTTNAMIAGGAIHYNLHGTEADKLDHLAGQSGIGNFMGGLQLPMLGRYEKGQGSFAQNHLMAARLPQGQLKAYPPKLQKWFKDAKVDTKAECYFIVFNNTAEAEDYRCNLAMHAMALPEYDSEHPTVARGNPRGVEAEVSGISTECRLSLFEPLGIDVSPDTKRGIGQGDADSGGKVSKFKTHAHGKKGFPPSLSPNEAEFFTQEGAAVSSVYFGAITRGRGIAIHALILNDDTAGTEGAVLKEAVAKPTVPEFLAHLESKPFFRLAKVRQTFTQA